MSPSSSDSDRAPPSGASSALDLAYPLDPAYGSGEGQRWIRLTGQDGRVDADLSDTFHEMHVALTHDGRNVGRITGHMARFPTTSCPGAISVLKELEGLSIAAPMAELYRGGRARHHCTHLFDLAVLAVAHARRSNGTRIYEAVVPDETDAPISIMVKRDGNTIHHWRIRDGTIIEPADLAGRPLLSGFARWASDIFSEAEYEAAFILERAWYIARGRRFDTEALAGASNMINPSMAGACYAYSGKQAKDGRLRDRHVDRHPHLASDVAPIGGPIQG